MNVVLIRVQDHPEGCVCPAHTAERAVQHVMQTILDQDPSPASQLAMAEDFYKLVSLLKAVKAFTEGHKVPWMSQLMAASVQPNAAILLWERLAFCLDHQGRNGQSFRDGIDQLNEALVAKFGY